MKRLVLMLVFLSLASCARPTNWLQQQPEKNTPQGKDKTPSSNLVHTTKVYDLVSAVTGQIKVPVDILWVIDNSGSMGNKQIAVSNNTSAFMTNFVTKTNLQWKMGLLSTTSYQAPFVGFTPQTKLDYTTPNPVQVFQNAVGMLGTNGADNEESWSPILNNLKKFPNFLTPGAVLALVFVTDEYEGSFEGSWGPAMTAQSFVNQLLAIKGGDLSSIVTYGVFGSTDRCADGNFYYPGSTWNDLMNITNGKTYRTCDPNFGAVLSDMGSDLVQKIISPHPVVLLGLTPEPSSIKVFYGGTQLRYGFLEDGGQWIYKPVDNVIQITDTAILLNTNKQITVEFDYDPNF